MWSPTHVQVTIQKAKDLLIKGKNFTNNSFVTISVGKENYQTSIKEKEGKDVSWHEQCELLIPRNGNVAEIVLTVLHRNNLGLDEFLGRVSIPLSSFDVYERPKSRWYKLEGKPGKEKGKDKYRGELEVRVGFTVKASTGSLMDLSKKEKHRSSLGHVSNLVSNSLLSLNSKDKKLGIKQIAKSISKKVSRKKRDSNGDGSSFGGSEESLGSSSLSTSKSSYKNVDPGVISEDEDEFTFDNLSHKSSETSINSSALENLAGGEFLRSSTKGPAKPPRMLSQVDKNDDEWTQKLFSKVDTLKHFNNDSGKYKSVPLPEEKLSSNSGIVSSKDSKSEVKKTNEVKSEVKKTNEVVSSTNKPNGERKSLSSSFKEKQVTSEPEGKEMTNLAKALLTTQFKKKDKKAMDRYVIGEEVNKVTEERSKHSKDVLIQFESKSRDDLIDMVIELQKDINRSNHQLKELEDYLDQLLLKVMETTPLILQNPYISCKTQATFGRR